MRINKDLIIEFEENLNEKKPIYVDEFLIQEYREPSSEEASYLISVKREEIKLDIEGFLILLERLEYLEEEWNWDKTLVEESRINVLKRILHYIVKNGIFRNIDWEVALKKISETDVNIEYNKEITKDSTNILIYDDWNLLQLFGSNKENYYLYLWYTTA